MAREAQTTKGATAAHPHYVDLFTVAVRDLPERSRRILQQRFGIDPTTPQTLESIGRNFGLTRERIRQIIAQALQAVAQRTHADVTLRKQIYAPLEAHLRKRSHIAPETAIVAAAARTTSPAEAGAVRFFLEAAENIQRLRRKDVVRAVVHVDFNEEQWSRVKDVVRAILTEVKEPLAHEILHKEYVKRAAAAGAPQVDATTLHHYIAPLADVKQNPFGRWGLAHWRDVTPRGVREKIYLVLREEGKPLHFREIARKIDEAGLSKKPGKATNPQTVHNELIKDPRFVLVGRGQYALAEWGYTPGTVRDVIAEILREAGHPLSTKEVIAAVLQRRNVRRMTVLVNLNQYFQKVSRGVYTLPPEGVQRSQRARTRT